MRKMFLSDIHLNNSYLNKLCHVEHLHIGGDELEFKDITNLIRLLKYKENLQSFQISFSRHRLSLNDRLDILGDEADSFIFPFTLFDEKLKVCSIKALSLYRNCPIMFVVERKFDNDNMLIKFEEKDIFLFSQAYTSSLIHGFKKHAV
ncbi:unnamed protein product [Auanema sp. JU1783]|nr:unnamed protein product [Auanema sp. JU1783]